MAQKDVIDQYFAQTRSIDMTGASDALTVPIGFLDVLNQCTSKSEVLEAYSVWAQRLAQADRCSVTLRDDGNWLMVSAMDGTHQQPISTNHPIANSTVGFVYQRTESLVLLDVGEVDLPDAQTIKQLGYTSSVLTPIVAGPHCFGTLAASYKQALQNPAKQLAIVQALARCVATQLLVIEQMERLTSLAQTDPLTGAGNRNQLADTIDATWVDWKENDRVFSFMTIDIDHFKSINDTYGHDAGDAVLRTLVSRLQANTRAGDSVIRLGGEEFGIVLQHCPAEKALPLAERFRKVVSDRPFDVGEREIKVTASIGLTQVQPSDRSFEEMLKRSDLALYDAKENGRDRVVAKIDA